MPDSANNTSSVVVVGGGNAALCAAIAAAEAGAAVTLLEAAAADEAGGNSWFTDGAMRVAFDEVAWLRRLLVDGAQSAEVVIAPYPAARYLADLRDAGGEHADHALLQTLAGRSGAALAWLARAVPLEWIADNQAFDLGGKKHFFGNLVVRAVGRGVGLVGALHARARRLGVSVRYGARGEELIGGDGGAVSGVVYRQDGARHRIAADGVVLACGGFEANREMRREYLGVRWADAVVRGSRHNDGAGLRMALAAGAARAGLWGGAHAVGTDANAPAFGDFQTHGDIWKKHSYPYGLLVNQNGERFVDEGADLRNYTYAKYGRMILQQPGRRAWQLFDAQTEPLLRDEYRHARAACIRADSHQQLAAQLDVNRRQLLATIAAYNDSVQPGAFNPAIKDGKHTAGLLPPKSNWALPLDAPPYLAYPVVCGITFTFGGVRVDANSAAVLGANGDTIAGLYAAGEMVGGIFGDNYPGGAGLMSGVVFGMLAGASAAA